MGNNESQCKKAIRIQNALSAYVYLLSWFLADFATQKAEKEQQLTKKRKKADKNAEERAEEKELNTVSALIMEAVELLVSKILGKDIHVLWKD